MSQTNIIDITLDREFRCKRVRSTGRQLYKNFDFDANSIHSLAIGEIYVRIMEKYQNMENLIFHFLPLLNDNFHGILLCVLIS